MNGFEINKIKDVRKPLYIQAIELLTTYIQGGQFKPGDLLPSEQELAAKLGISRGTLREAMGHLETHGLISRKPGRGTFVTIPYGEGFLGGLERLEPFRVLAERAGVSSEVVTREVEIIPASARMAQMIGVAEGTTLTCIKVIEAVEGKRCMYIENYLINDENQRQDLEIFENSVLVYLLKHKSHAVAYTRSEIFAIDAGEFIANKLGTYEGKSVLQLVETYFTKEGEIRGVGLVYLLTNHFHFYLTRRVTGT